MPYNKQNNPNKNGSIHHANRTRQYEQLYAINNLARMYGITYPSVEHRIRDIHVIFLFLITEHSFVIYYCEIHLNSAGPHLS